MSQTADRQTILVVDDTPVILKMLTKQLEHWGYRVLTAASGEEGLQRAETEQPDLILLDILMPKMKGREACARLKANSATKHIPVMFLTSLGLGEYVRAGLDIGGDDYIIKPFRPTYLRERIKVCLLRSQQSRPSGSNGAA
ncbi:MAG: response regulator [Candidatus Omnitrophica bacterium]|nr:response regulator [Candidatus Omnitrophota bacterium]